MKLGLEESRIKILSKQSDPSKERQISSCLREIAQELFAFNQNQICSVVTDKLKSPFFLALSKNHQWILINELIKESADK